MTDHKWTNGYTWEPKYPIMNANVSLILSGNLLIQGSYENIRRYLLDAAEYVGQRFIFQKNAIYVLDKDGMSGGMKWRGSITSPGTFKLERRVSYFGPISDQIR